MGIPPQTGAGGQANTQDLLQQVLSVSGTGSGGMVPAGSTGIGPFTTNGTNVPATYSSATGALNIPNYLAMPPAGSTGITALTTSGVSGAATYSPSTGALNIPVYASGALNVQQSSLTANTGFSNTTMQAIGNGTAFLFTANVNPCVVLSFFQLISTTGTSVIPAIDIIRSTNTTIPPPAAPVPSADYTVLETRLIASAQPYVMSGSVIDHGITVGVTYCYYLAIWITNGTSPVATLQSGINNSSFSAFELK